MVFKEYNKDNIHDYFKNVLNCLIHEKIDVDIEGKQELAESLNRFLKKSRAALEIKSFFKEKVSKTSPINILYNCESSKSREEYGDSINDNILFIKINTI